MKIRDIGLVYINNQELLTLSIRLAENRIVPLPRNCNLVVFFFSFSLKIYLVLATDFTPKLATEIGPKLATGPSRY